MSKKNGHVATQQAIKRLGGKIKTANAFGVTRQAIQRWARNGAPQDRVEKLSRLSGISSRRLSKPLSQTAQS